MSSTFSDFAVERDALRRDVWPVLRRFCAARGARFQEVDLRWGVSEEAALDQQTMNICLGEIERCHRITPRPNFLVLVGNRAGWMPPPPQIPAAEWDQILPTLSESDRTFLGGWYVRDDNAVPAEYRLQPRTGEFEDADVWAPEEARLRSVLAAAVAGLGFDEARERPYLWSATGQEIAVGALEAARPGQVVCFTRTITGYADPVTAGPDDPVRAWMDPDQAPLDAVKEQLRRLLKPQHDTGPRSTDEDRTDQGEGGDAETALSKVERLIEETVPWRPAVPDEVASELVELVGIEVEPEGGPVLDEAYLARFGSRVLAALMAAITEELGHSTLPPGPGSDDPFLDAEGRAHLGFAADKRRFFTGRTRELASISNHLAGTDSRPLVVWGEGGTGKSALIATAAGQVAAQLPHAVVVTRFVGATPSSSDGRALLASVCGELARRAGDTQAQMPTDYDELVEDFTARLGKATAGRPIVVIVDSLDQLAPGPARSLGWMPSVLPEHVRLIVSTRPGDTLTPRQQDAELVEVTGLPATDGERLLDAWLADAGRTLQSAQRRHVLDAFDRSAGNPLYLRLAFEEARRWTSTEPPQQLAIGLPELMRDNLFARLSREDQHGAVLVAHTLGYLAEPVKSFV